MRRISLTCFVLLALLPPLRAYAADPAKELVAEMEQAGKAQQEQLKQAIKEAQADPVGAAARMQNKQEKSFPGSVPPSNTQQGAAQGSAQAPKPIYGDIIIHR